MATETPDINLSTSQTSSSAETLSPLEQEVLDEYARLLGNLSNVRHTSPLPT
jgi:DASH complex subunit DAD3